MGPPTDGPQRPYLIHSSYCTVLEQLTFVHRDFKLSMYLWYSSVSRHCCYIDHCGSGRTLPSHTHSWPVLTTLVHPTSRWLHWATSQHHSALSFASSSASSQAKSICLRSRLMTSTQFFLGRLLALALNLHWPTHRH